MLEGLIRVLAHVLTPLFFAGLLGSTLVVIAKLGSDIIEFFEDDPSNDVADPPR